MTPRLLAGLLATTTLVAGPAVAAPVFNRVATFETTQNLPEAERGSPTVSEIVSATEDGMTLVYTDSPGKRLGLIDIADPRAPKPAGVVALDGEPTSVKVVGGKAFVGVVTSESKANPSGHLAIVDLAGKTVEAKCDLGGQPDSVAVSPDKAHLAIAIENERDEEIDDGKLPQMPAGFLALLAVKDGVADCASLKRVDLTGLAEVAPEDPEPEFVAINGRNEAVLTLQENNHIAVIDLATAKVARHFSAGAVDLDKIDTEKDGKIELTGKIDGALREPDGVVWLDDSRFVTANEGDYKGGSRGFTIWNADGTVAWESGASLEYEAVSLGHYPDKRNKKGIEIEGVEAGIYGDDRLIFVASERASIVGVYKDTGAAPELLQVLPSGIGPEGVLAIPSRNLLVTANETDLVEDGGVRAHVMIYERTEGVAQYPTIRSASAGADTIPFGALSGLAADRTTAARLYAVTDSVYSAAPRILTIDAGKAPAEIVAATPVTRDGAAAEGLDLEGIATRADGGFWLASEGNPKKDVKNLLLKVAADGAILEEIELPEDLVKGATNYGFEGVTTVGSGDDEVVWLAIQRAWADDAPDETKLVAYTPASKSWGAVRYPLDKAAGGAWIGLSEITAAGDRFVLIERDNQIGGKAALKALTTVDAAAMKPAALGGDLPLVAKTVARDLIPDLEAFNGYVVDKVEGFAIDAAGDAYAVTDNDGVDDSSGETLFLKLGKDWAAN
ncbi:esterase-like activity of phytase family protein [Pleomorphomonas carboxyditropha]|uniref:Alkaline phosphatase n=1 Tax=Pleomorphomonas carboxyditropha TaxID=2023338 RepID=A0A2G9WQZ1_9HYPH|nr:esterase-like activity of phytase family protein [Pleomorphomonas carboxyditropha]PIO97084.1 alkaline phosphatase [Pleomorphomonas carboxyditropha]